jgi:hypothetical protein
MQVKKKKKEKKNEFLAKSPLEMNYSFLGKVTTLGGGVFF